VSLVKKVWVLGSTGMLGSELCLLLKKKGIPFVGTDKGQADVSSLKSLENFSKDLEISHIFNCTAYKKVDQAEKEKDLASLVNAQGPENMGRLAGEKGAKLIHFSTDYVFEGSRFYPYCEEDTPNPLNTYGNTKWEGEKRLLALMPDACIIRTSWLCGHHGLNFISKMLKLMQEKSEIKVVHDQKGRPTFCEDLAACAWELRDCSGIFHFANTGEASWYEFALGIYEEAKKKFPLVCEKMIPISSDQFPALAKRPAYSVLDTKKVEALLKRRPRSWKEALQTYMQKL
jgi:dTDP-4-dehydrorhamnose reductase